ncbi:citrate (Si)-synthase [Candidatus Sumerlaeota bacterium]|nr:citrate (Si)-synthase [Candidatus Sumerlaeota bacterium]
MATLQETLEAKIPQWRSEIGALVKAHGDDVISQVTVKQAFGGMRGVKAMICDTSLVEPDKGLIIRGHPLLTIKDKWPEEIFFLLLTGELPDAAAKAALQADLDKRAEVPAYVWAVLEAMPKDSHPMVMLDTAILVMECESEFRRSYDAGVKKEDYWKPALEDALKIIATSATIAAGIYRMRYDKGPRIDWTPGLDQGANYAKMLGLPDPKGTFADLMRLYLNFHSDHEGGNVSANTCHTVGSALSDPYYAVSAGLNGLAGPLHGLANQECLGWIIETMEKFGGVPSEKQIREYAFETLRSGKVIPGYGHAVLRVTDPRFAGFNEFGRKHMADDPVFKTVDLVFNVVPKVLEEYSAERVAAGKNPIANCWPNVDAGSGALLHHYGLKEFAYYTVLFSVSRMLGMLAQLVWNRAMGTAITRPKSVQSSWVAQQVGFKG